MKDRYDPAARSEIYFKRKERAVAESSKWSRTEKGRVSKRASWQRYKARQLTAEGSFTAEDIKDLYASQGGRCYYCSVEIEEGYHIEHMIPLSREGRNDVSNICLACAPCNLRKYTKTAEEFQNE
jgi:5-methylcytosine-specific restriction endonuclease McrA